MRKRNVLETTKEIIKSGEKPSVQKISAKLNYPPQDVHRCLNALEKDKEIETYTKEILGNKVRMVGVKR